MLTLYADFCGIYGKNRYQKAYWKIQEELPMGFQERRMRQKQVMQLGCRLEGVPGFFVNRNGDWEIAFYKKNSGYLCPVWSEDGLLIAFQIRLDVPYQKRKYIWLSSAKLKKGCSPGSPVSVSGDSGARKVYVTEGILKAEITHQRTGGTYIGNPGVMNYKELSLTCSRAAWDVNTDGMWQGNYKGIDDWELRGSEDFYGNAAA